MEHPPHASYATYTSVHHHRELLSELRVAQLEKVHMSHTSDARIRMSLWFLGALVCVCLCVCGVC
jgi:hypothetical protein